MKLRGEGRLLKVCKRISYHDNRYDKLTDEPISIIESGKCLFYGIY